MSAGVKAFVDDHLDDPRNHPVNTYEELYEGDIFYLLLIDDYDKLKLSMIYLKKIIMLSLIRKCILMTGG